MEACNNRKGGGTMKKINYTDDTPSEYAAALNAADTLDSLIDTIKEYDDVTWDALEIAEAMSQNDFIEFRKALKKERNKKFSGKRSAEKYGAIFAPQKMLKVSIVANYFKVPWGCAFIRMKDTGIL